MNLLSAQALITMKLDGKSNDDIATLVSDPSSTKVLAEMGLPLSTMGRVGGFYGKKVAGSLGMIPVFAGYEKYKSHRKKKRKAQRISRSLKAYHRSR